MADEQIQNDHDLLLELKGDVKALRLDMKDLKDNFKDTLADHEKRLRFLESWVWRVIGALVIIQFIFYYLTH